jgi:hypothetical protein
MDSNLEKYIKALKKLGIIKDKLKDNKEAIKDIELVINAIAREMTLLK